MNTSPQIKKTVMEHHFIIVDDDHINNVICRKTIIDTLSDVYVETFADPEVALKYLNAMIANKDNGEIILLLDISMPSLTGWEFLEAFESLDSRLKARFKIYLLSSSEDENDKCRAANYKNVCGYIEKPLNRDMTQKLK